MQQRELGRPSGTDGSDFSYCMVVDSRYTKVAKGKSHLYSLILIQAVVYLVGLLFTVVLSPKEDGLKRLEIFSNFVGFVSVITGEIEGRRSSRATMLRVYIIASSTAILLSAFCAFSNSTTLQVILNPSVWKAKKLKVVEMARIFTGMLVQMVTLRITVCLIGNMSPSKKSC